jgi:hypothetical protein
MGLMQLLTVGRSLGKIGDQPSRYKMTQQSLLPKFGSVKAPEERVPVGVGNNQAIAKTELKQSSLGFAAAKDRKTMNTVQPKPQEVTVPPKTVAPRPAFPLGRWTLFRNPFSKTPKPKAAEPAIQPELSLDMVKPVRNDLSDADLELVQSSKRVPEKVEKVVPAKTQVEPVVVTAEGASWGRIKTQFFGAGKA